MAGDHGLGRLQREALRCAGSRARGRNPAALGRQEAMSTEDVLALTPRLTPFQAVRQQCRLTPVLVITASA